MAEEWYSPKEIYYSVYQIKWLLHYLPLIRRGEWPPEHRETGYAGTDKQNQGTSFEDAVIVAADLDFWLQKAGWQGLITEMVFSGGQEDSGFISQHVAQALNMDAREVSQTVGKTLEYISEKLMAKKKGIKKQGA